MVYYNYPASGIGGALVRLDNIASDNTDPAEADKFAAYGYLGAGTVVKVAYPAVTVSSNPLALTYWTSGGGYSGFDGLGRVIAQKWQIQSAGAVKDHFTYGYDGNSSRLYRTNELSHTFDELYHANGSTGSYDGLDRLKDFRRGTLTASGQVLDTVATASRAQQWALDAVGNWSTYKEDADGSGWDLEQDREHDVANQITSIDGSWVDPAYDLAGNMTTGPKPDSPATPQVCTYDAWNRLMTVSEGSGTPTLIVTYSYDGLNRRIRKVLAVPDPDVTYDYYYNERWQVLEVRKGGNANPYEQYVWGLQYVDAPVVRFRDHTGGEGGTPDGTVDDTLYYTYDGNFNVTGLIEPDGDVVERYVYDPYGKVSFLDGSWGALSASAFDNQILYCGYRFDPESGLFHVRRRPYHPTLGRWVTKDPAGHVDGPSLYQVVRSNPTRYNDPFGLAVIPITLEPPTPGTVPWWNHVYRCGNNNGGCLYGYDLGGRVTGRNTRGPTPPVPSPKPFCVTIRVPRLGTVTTAPDGTTIIDLGDTEVEAQGLRYVGGVGMDACEYYDDLDAAGDDYGKIAAQACRGQKVQMAGVTVDWIKDGPWSRCIRKCLLEWEYACAKNDQPCGMNKCRLVAHTNCYAGCSAMATMVNLLVLLDSKLEKQKWWDYPSDKSNMFALGSSSLADLLKDINHTGGEYRVCFGEPPVAVSTTMPASAPPSGSTPN